MSDRPRIVFLKGPTASGKTAAAVELVQRLPMEIISVDSALVYRGMDVGTSKPDAGLLAKAPHRLINMVEPTEAYSAAQFRADALREIEDILAQGKTPLLVGGTMLYFKALAEGLSPLPTADEAVRARLEAVLAEQGLAVLHQRLCQVDPESGQRIHPNDPQRIVRALEVFELTGRPMSELWREQQEQSLPYEVINLALVPEDRAILHERIGIRFDQMLADGLVDEVRRLRELPGMSPDLPSMRSVGYRQAWQYLDGELEYEQMRMDGIVATRRLAKRQLTWLRGEKDLECLDMMAANLLDQLLLKVSPACNQSR
ncbi:MAG: tRNA (adenosine(37)-N6)-dimethylallyltransferase MiaA [Gammaproteobacteria bacterium]|nr:tRNA (adenosine(37)-N6)-dimethylallyltransferase MiaA [Gammaproteobacteria bacterium]